MEWICTYCTSKMYFYKLFGILKLSADRIPVNHLLLNVWIIIQELQQIPFLLDLVDALN